MASQRESGQTRKERERERHRVDILNAAERVFVRDGYHGATVEEIAGEAEFAVGTLYHFFSGKEELYLEVLGRLGGSLMRDFDREVTSRDDPEEAIRALFDLRLRQLEEHRDLFRIAIETGQWGQAGGPEGLPPGLAVLYERYLGVVSDILRRGMQQGRFIEFEPLFVALCLEGVFRAMTLYWTQYHPEEPLAELAGRARDAFLGQIRVRGPEADVEEAGSP